jgi:hypothetical protein
MRNVELGKLNAEIELVPYMKLHLTNAEVGMRNAEGWSRCAQSFFLVDRIHSFDIRHLLFDILFF